MKKIINKSLQPTRGFLQLGHGVKAIVRFPKTQHFKIEDVAIF